MLVFRGIIAIVFYSTHPCPRYTIVLQSFPPKVPRGWLGLTGPHAQRRTLSSPEDLENVHWVLELVMGCIGQQIWPLHILTFWKYITATWQKKTQEFPMKIIRIIVSKGASIIFDLNKCHHSNRALNIEDVRRPQRSKAAFSSKADGTGSGSRLRKTEKKKQPWKM